MNTSIVKSSSYVFLAKLLKLSISLGTGIFLARWLQPEGRGVYSLITQFHLMTVAFSGMSIGYATIHFSGDNRYSAAEQVSNSVFSAIIFSILPCSLVILSYSKINALLSLDKSIFLLIAILIPISILDSSLRAVLQSKYRFVWLNLLDIIQITVLGVGLIVGYFFLKASIVHAIVIWSISLCLPFFILLRMVSSVTHLSFKFDREIFKKHFQFGLKAHLSTVIGLLSLRFDQYLLGYLTNAAEVGKYSVAVSMSELLWHIPSSVSFVLLPRMAQAGKKESVFIVKRTCLWVFIILFVSALILAIGAKPLIHYAFGDSYRASIEALWLLLPGVIAVGITTVTTPYFLGRLGKPHLGAFVAAISLTTNLLLNLLLIPRLGMNGAAISASISYCFATILNLYLFYKSCSQK
ncbi:flippase [Geobacter sulfurreducens]|uniref:flippase n=1 Tax=Geobacter sulfurreducens TaxID=35554 RepID=UPI0001D8F1B6|nr:flippase [Geobacter sulfurreducens]ADI84691.1 polysaccharide biosynthesis membrane protein [Geobacter sulfurreducens KN400]